MTSINAKTKVQLGLYESNYQLYFVSLDQLQHFLHAFNNYFLIFVYLSYILCMRWRWKAIAARAERTLRVESRVLRARDWAPGFPHRLVGAPFSRTLKRISLARQCLGRVSSDFRGRLGTKLHSPTNVSERAGRRRQSFRC
jgi:hypothetical protein